MRDTFDKKDVAMLPEALCRQSSERSCTLPMICVNETKQRGQLCRNACQHKSRSSEQQEGEATAEEELRAEEDEEEEGFKAVETT